MELEPYQKYILAIAGHRSLTKAAKALEISQPALSMALGKAEKKLGFPVFDRSRTPAAVTPEGQIYLEYLKKELQIQQDCDRQIADLTDAENAVLTVGAPAVYAQTVLLDALESFRKENPRCRIFIKEAPLADLIRLSRDGKLDCFVSTSENLPDSFEHRILKPERIYLCVPADWEINRTLTRYRVRPGETGPAPDITCFREMPFLFLEPGQPLQKETERFLRQAGISPGSTITVNQVALGVKLAERGLGMMFASEEGLRQCSRPDRLCIYPLPEGISSRMIYAACDKSHYQTRICRRFLETLKNVTAQPAKGTNAAAEDRLL